MAQPQLLKFMTAYHSTANRSRVRLRRHRRAFVRPHTRALRWSRSRAGGRHARESRLGLVILQMIFLPPNTDFVSRRFGIL